jgi:Zn-dependent protease with chaperone function
VSGIKDLKWEFFVIQSPIPNAFVTPNGKVIKRKRERERERERERNEEHLNIGE